MPGRDGTGPMGQGAMTGRGAGFCNTTGAAFNGAGFGFRAFGRGRGCGMGMGRGMGRGFLAQPAPQTQPMNRDAQINAIENEIQALSGRLETLKKED